MKIEEARGVKREKGKAEGEKIVISPQNLHANWSGWKGEGANWMDSCRNLWGRGEYVVEEAVVVEASPVGFVRVASLLGGTVGGGGGRSQSQIGTGN